MFAFREYTSQEVQNGADGCGEYDYNADEILVHPSMVAEAGNLIDQVKHVMAHEIGHLLSLTHDNDSG